MERVFRISSTGKLIDCTDCFPKTINRWYSYQSCSIVEDDKLITCIIGIKDDLFIEFYYLGHKIRNSLKRSFIDNYEVDNKTMEYVTELIDKDRSEEFLKLVDDLFINSLLS